MASRESSRPPRSVESATSNILNYLVWRYLQEAGFAMAATWLGKEWHRDPDSVMPFAKHVKQYQLIHMVQDAMFLDDIRSREVRENHKYYFGDDDGPKYARPSYDIAGIRKPEDIPKRQMSIEHNGSNGAIDEDLLRRKKRKEPRVNGDAMDIEENGYGPSAQHSEAESPAPAVQEVPLLDTLTIGESRLVSTEKPRDLSSDSKLLPWPDKCNITSASWSTSRPEPLLIGGANLLRLFAVSDNPSNEAMTIDIDVSRNDFDVGEICWVGEDTAAVSLVERTEPTDVDDDEDEGVGKLVYLTSWGRSEPQEFASMTGSVFALRYNAESELLLVLSGGADSIISIYKVASQEPELLCSKSIPSTQLYDAAWINPTKFIACGTNMLQIFTFAHPGEIISEQTQQMQNSWFQIKYDSACNVAIFSNEDMTSLRQYSLDSEDTKTEHFTSPLTDFSFQPLSGPYVPGTRRFLATSTRDNIIQLWDVTRPFTCVYKLGTFEVFQDSCLLQIAWSPDGDSLAGAGFDTVAIWKPDEGGQMKGIWRCTEEGKWQSRPEGPGQGDWVHNLVWDTDGRKLVFTLNEQAVVIRAP